MSSALFPVVSRTSHSLPLLLLHTLKFGTIPFIRIHILILVSRWGLVRIASILPTRDVPFPIYFGGVCGGGGLGGRGLGGVRGGWRTRRRGGVRARGGGVRVEVGVERGGALIVFASGVPCRKRKSIVVSLKNVKRNDALGGGGASPVELTN